MSFKLLGGGSDLNTVISDVNQNILEMKGREVTEIFKDDTGTRRVILGKRGDEYGLFVSKPTFDVYDAGNDELIFNSGQNVFKIVASGDATVSVTAADGGQAVIEHNLGFTPIPAVFVNDTTYQQLPYTQYTSVTVGATTGWLPTVLMSARVDDTQLNIFVDYPLGSSNTTSWQFKYYLLQETAN